MKTRVRVKRVELLKIVEGRMRKAEKDFQRASEAYPVAMQKWSDTQTTRLEKLVAKGRNGGLTAEDTRRFSIAYPPDKPSEGRELCNLRRMVATLKIGAEDTILLSQEDADYYFGPCKL